MHGTPAEPRARPTAEPNCEGRSWEEEEGCAVERFRARARRLAARRRVVELSQHGGAVHIRAEGLRTSINGGDRIVCVARRK
jgi:hypothetical protein